MAIDNRLAKLGISNIGNLSIYELADQRYPLDTMGIPSPDLDKITALRDLISEINRTPGVDTRKPINTPHQAALLMLPVFRGIRHEELWSVLLDGANRPIAKKMLSSGGEDQTTFDLRMILRTALMYGARSIIIAHNHPGGNPAPSIADMRNTGRLKAAANMLDISLLDHVILSGHQFFSFADERVYDFRDIDHS